MKLPVPPVITHHCTLNRISTIIHRWWEMVQSSADACAYIFCLTKCSGKLRALLEISPLSLKDHLTHQRVRLSSHNKQSRDKLKTDDNFWFMLEFYTTYCSSVFWKMMLTFILWSLFHISLFLQMTNKFSKISGLDKTQRKNKIILCTTRARWEIILK